MYATQARMIAESISLLVKHGRARKIDDRYEWVSKKEDGP